MRFAENTIYFAIDGYLDYNKSMKTVIAIVVAIFLFIWGLGLFLGFISGVKKFKMPESQTNEYGPAYLNEQKRLADESEESRRKMMQDLQFQTQQYKEPFKSNPSFGKF